MGKLNKTPFITNAEIEEILKKPFPDPLDDISEEEDLLFDYWITGDLNLPEDNLLQKRYKENKRKELEEKIKELNNGFDGNF